MQRVTVVRAASRAPNRGSNSIQSGYGANRESRSDFSFRCGAALPNGCNRIARRQILESENERKTETHASYTRFRFESEVNIPLYRLCQFVCCLLFFIDTDVAAFSALSLCRSVFFRLHSSTVVRFSLAGRLQSSAVGSAPERDETAKCTQNCFQQHNNICLATQARCARTHNVFLLICSGR